MPRTAPAGTGPGNVERIFLVDVTFWDGSSDVHLRVTSSNEDVTVDADGDSTAETYTGAGTLLEIAPQVENTDRRSQGVAVTLSGLDTTVISTLLQNDFRGRQLRIWRAVVDQATGAITETYLLHRGLQLEDYRFTIQQPDEKGQPMTASIGTRSVSRLVALQRTNAVKANQESHNEMLHRAGLSTGDTGLFYTKQLPGRIFWGTEMPDEATDGKHAGASAGTSGGSSGGGFGGGGGGRAPFLPSF